MVLGAGAVVIAAAVLLFASQDGSGQLQQRLYSRQTTTIKLIADGQKNISNEDLSKLNSELSLILSGDNAALKKALINAGVTKIDPAIKASESETALFADLVQAKLNAGYDDAYRSALTQKLESLQALLKEVNQKTRSSELKKATSTEYKHLTSYINTLTELSKNN